MKKKKRVKGKLLLCLTAVTLILVSAVCLYARLKPSEYANLIEKYAEEYCLPAELIYGVIATESGFDPKAQSNMDAKGLMQLTDETFEFVGYKLGENLSLDEVFDPETNIRYGTYLLSFLIDYFGNTDTALAAYNAGIGCVEGWLQNDDYSRDGVTLYNIPYEETRLYVIKVNAAMKLYGIGQEK